MSLLESVMRTERIFPGLRPFEEEDAVLFFGRNEQTDDLLRRLEHTRLLAIVGLSGSGKSSLVRAGLLPALRRGHLSGAGPRWHLVVMRPGADPLGALARSMDDVVGQLDERLEILRSGSFGLVDVSRYGRDAEENLLIVVDQFEEIFRFQREHPTHEQEAQKFVSLLLTAVQECEPRYRIYVVITMRSDYLGECARFTGLPEALNDSQYLVPRMTREQVREAIAGPAALGGVEIQAELLEHLVNQTGTDPDELPVLQHLLMRMWEVRETTNGGSRITLAQLESVGGWNDALTRHGDRMLKALDAEGSALAKRVFQRLTEKGEASRESRRRATLGELAAVAEAREDQATVVIDHFRQEGCNFLTASDLQITRDSVIDISHESLIRRWKTLRNWVDEEADSAEWYRRVEDDNRQFEKGRTGPMLDPALQFALQEKREKRWNAAWAARYARGIDQTLPEGTFDRAMAFLDFSQRKQQWKRAYQRFALLAALTTVAVGTLSYWFLLRATELEVSLRYASTEPDPLFRGLLMAELADAAGPLFRTLLMGRALLTAESRDDSGPFDILSFQQAATEAIPVAVLRSRVEDGPLKAAVFSSTDRNQVGAVSTSGTVLWWNSDGRGLPGRVRIGEPLDSSEASEEVERQATAVAFSRDGNWVVAAFRVSEPGKTDADVVWFGQSNGSSTWTRFKIEPGNGSIRALTFSPEGKRILAGYDSGLLQLWNTDGTGVIVARPPTGSLRDGVSSGGHGGPITRVAFDPGGTRVVSASLDRTARIWGLDLQEEAVRVLALESAATGIDFSRDGQWLVCAFADMARIWPDGGLGDPINLRGNRQSVTGVWFSPHHTNAVVLASADGAAQIWKVPALSEQQGDPTLAMSLTGHSAPVRDLAFSTDGRLITVSDDGTARIWLAHSREPFTLGSHQSRIKSVAFSPDGTKIATTGDESTARIWTVDGSAPARTLEGHTDWVRGAAFSPNGTSVVTASDDGSWLVHEVDGSKPRVGVKNQGPLLSVAFDPSDATGTRLITSHRVDNTAKVWSLEDPGKPQMVLEGHTDWVWSAAFSRDGTRIVTASADGTARIWSAESGETMTVLKGHTASVLSAAFSPDGLRVVTASRDRTARVWREGKELSVLRHVGAVNRAGFSWNGEWVVTASDDGTARVWNVDGSQRLALQNGAAVRAAVFDPRDSTVVTGDDDGQVRVWRISLPVLTDFLKRASTACVPADMRIRFLGQSDDAAASSYQECERRHGR